jgi:hypothetical protein
MTLSHSRYAYYKMVTYQINYPEIIDELKQKSHIVGQGIDTVLFIGGLYLRNLIFLELGFSLIDN